MNRAEAIAVCAEVVRRAGVDLIDEAFVKQARFIRDRSRRKAALCTRRAGKTQAAARMLLRAARRRARVHTLYVALTRASAKAILWEDLKELAKKKGTECTPNESDLILELANGSTIQLFGADATDKQKEKLKGQKFALIVLDECGSWKAHIRALVDDVLWPTLIDLRGTLVAIGTPGEIPAGWFYDVTTGKEPGWSLHSWSTAENPYLAANWDQELAELKANKPGIIETPTFRRNYLGQWVIESGRLVYKFDVRRNTFTDLPRLADGDVWRWVLGIDFGWDDATALVLGCYARTQRHYYVVEAFKESEMLLSAVDAKMRELQERHKIRAFSHIVVDNAGKQAVEDMRDRYHWAFEAAEKSGKVAFIRRVNDDMIMGEVKIHADRCDPLVTELVEHIWAPKKTPGELEEPEEDPSSPNHCCDGYLYSYRRARHYLAKPTKEQPKPGTPEHTAKIEREMKQRAQARVKQSNNPRSPVPWLRKRVSNG